ncbi:hypothetical protein DFQ26_006938 [Actinomortierella ambigua]|nr:hypothetical protein DFQ26_006938 [Actinomortierella ambigua]
MAEGFGHRQEDGDNSGTGELNEVLHDGHTSTSERTDGTGSSLGESDSSVFGDDLPSSESSDDDENDAYTPNLQDVKRSSGIGLNPEAAEALLGPPVLGDDGDHTADMSLVDSTQTSFPDLDRDDSWTGTSFPDNEELEDHSLFRFKNHRSSIPSRHSFTTDPHEPVQDEGDDSMDVTNCIGGIVDATQALEVDAQDGSKNSPAEKTAETILHGINKSPAFATPNTEWAQEDVTDMDITTPIGVGIHAESLVDMTAPFGSSLEDVTANFSDASAMDFTQPIGVGILESQTPNFASQETSQTNSQVRQEGVDNATPGVEPVPEAMDEDTQTQYDAPSTEVASDMTQESLREQEMENAEQEHTDRRSLKPGQVNGSEMPPPSTPPRRKSRSSFTTAGGDGQDKRLSQSTSTTPTGSPPSTPPRRTSHSLLGSPTPGTPRRGLATPARFTPSTKARYHVFPEIFERQLNDARPSGTAPVFNNNYSVSPETSSLAKRIARYSTGARASFDSTVGDVAAEKRRNTFDVDTSKRAGTSGIRHPPSLGVSASGAQQSVADSLRAIANEGKSVSEGSSHDLHTKEAASKPMLPPLAAAAAPEPTPAQPLTPKATEGGDTVMEKDDEDEPISLKTFLSLVGISFMDNLQSAHRRRTLLAEPKPSSPYAAEDYVKAMAILTPELDQYKSSCENAKSYIEESRKVVQEMETRVDSENPEFFAEYLDGEPAFQEFMRERFRMIKVHSRLAATEAWYQWREDMIKIQLDAFDHHLSKLKEDRAKVSALMKEAARVNPGVTQRHMELKKQLQQARERQQAFAQCDKEQLASLAEAIEEQGNQLNLFKRKLASKTNELAELTRKVEQLRVTERTERAHIAAAGKTIKDNQYIKDSDLARAKDQLATLQAIHLWRPLPPSSPPSAILSASSSTSQTLAKADRVVRLVFDESLLVKIDLEKLLAGKRLEGVQITGYDGSEPDPLDSFQPSRRFISSMPVPKFKPLPEFAGLLRDFIAKVVEKYKTETTIQRILTDVGTFWTRVKHIRHEIRMIRAHHVVDLVAGSQENLEELQQQHRDSPSVDPFPSPPHYSVSRSPGPPIVVLDIRVRFNIPVSGKREQPTKFYVWFTFTLNDLLSFPGPDSFSWRIEIVHGEINVEPINTVVATHSKTGGFNVLQKICTAIRQTFM